MDKPPDFNEIVLKKDPPCYLVAMMNEQINPVNNKNWAQDLHDKSVSPEIDEAITRSRAASIVSIDPSLQARLANHPMMMLQQPNTLAVPGGVYSLQGGGIRRATVADIHHHAGGQLGRIARTRTTSMSPPVGTIWIGV